MTLEYLLPKNVNISPYLTKRLNILNPTMKINITQPHWKSLVETEQSKPYFQSLSQAISEQRKAGITIYPHDADVFNAFNYVDLSDIKVVVLGQDPYHGANKYGLPQAHGLAFSVPPEVKVPPSLVNIFKELITDINGFDTPSHGHLIKWAEQGVLLLNTVLTVQQAQAHSHAKLGWETFTDKVIETLNQENSGCVFILWGSHAHKKGKHINTEKHKVLKSVHPSPLSVYRGFYGSKPFSQANTWLAEQGKKTIDWKL